MGTTEPSAGAIEQLSTENSAIAHTVVAHNAASAILARFGPAPSAEAQVDLYVKLLKKIYDGM